MLEQVALAGVLSSPTTNRNEHPMSNHLSDEPESPDGASEREREHSSGSEKDRTDTAGAPFAPDENDDSPLGDTDQHSDA
jgi:hypothetical protein